MRRLLAGVALAAVSLAPAAPYAYASGSCGGHVDTNCTGWVCPTDCWQRSCDVWVDALKDPMTAQCVNLPVAS